MLFKYGGKIAAVIKAAFSGNFGDGKIGLPEQAFRIADAHIGNILIHTDAGDLLEFPGKMAFVDPELIAELGKGDILGIILADIFGYIVYHLIGFGNG